MSCDLGGMAELETALGVFDESIRENVRKSLAAWAARVESSARQNVPVKTGYLRSTIQAKLQDWTAEIGAEAEYTSSVEFGSRYARAHPYLRPAIEEHLPDLEQVVCEAIDSAKSEAGL